MQFNHTLRFLFVCLFLSLFVLEVFLQELKGNLIWSLLLIQNITNTAQPDGLVSIENDFFLPPSKTHRVVDTLSICQHLISDAFSDKLYQIQDCFGTAATELIRRIDLFFAAASSQEMSFHSTLMFWPEVGANSTKIVFKRVFSCFFHLTVPFCWHRVLLTNTVAVMRGVTRCR